MARRIPLAWLQLSRDRLRLLVAVAGVSFAAILVSMQLGFRSAMYDSAVRYHERLRYDLVMLKGPSWSRELRAGAAQDQVPRAADGHDGARGWIRDQRAQGIGQDARVERFELQRRNARDVENRLAMQTRSCTGSMSSEN